MADDKQLLRKSYTYLISAFTTLVCTYNLFAQISPMPGTTFNVEVGQYFEQQFSFNPPFTGTWSSTLNLTTTGVSMSPDGLLSGKPKKNLNCIDFQVLRNGIFPTDYHLCIRRPGANIMLVLDKSGSMNQASGASTKWKVLKDCVNSFISDLRSWNEDRVKDSLGIVYFSHERADFTIGGVAGLKLFNNPPGTPINLADISRDLTSKSPGGATCIGGGLLAAFDEFSKAMIDSGTVILFSDGIENRDPSFSGTLTIDNHGMYSIAPDFSGFSLPLNLAADRKLKIHTICIGDLTLADLMDDISRSTTDDHFDGLNQDIISSADFILTLNDMFDNLLVADFGPFSPAIVDKKIHVLGSDRLEQKFKVNNSADKILIKAVGENIRRGMKMEVEKDGISFSHLLKYDNSFIRFFAEVDTVEALGASMGGEWNVHISGKNSGRFSTTCIINDEYVDYKCLIEKDLIDPGDIIPLKLEVSTNGIPFTTLSAAQAIIFKADRDFNDLYSEANSSIQSPPGWPSEKQISLGQDKFEKLLAFDSSFVNALIPKENLVELNNNGDGSYSNQFNNTEESGIYTIVFRFRGSDNETGTFERYKSFTKVIDFGQADQKETVFKISWGNFGKQFVITPKNKYRHLIGPNRLSQINLELRDRKLNLVDNLDGTYLAKAPFFSLFNLNSSVKLDIKSDNFITTTLKEVDGVSLWQDILVQVSIIIVILLMLYIILRRII